MGKAYYRDTDMQTNVITDKRSLTGTKGDSPRTDGKTKWRNRQKEQEQKEEE